MAFWQWSMCHRPWPTCLTGFGRVPPKKTALPVVQMALSLFAGATALRFGTRPSLFFWFIASRDSNRCLRSCENATVGSDREKFVGSDRERFLINCRWSLPLSDPPSFLSPAIDRKRFDIRSSLSLLRSLSPHCRRTWI